jgi:hypothetical protein
MTRDEAIRFLREHQPMPADGELSTETISRYDEARKLFLQHPDPESVPLFLGSFGEGDGFGVYQLIGDVIVQLDRDVVLPHLAEALRSAHRSVRYWSAQIAALVPDSRLAERLTGLLADEDSGVRYAAVTALEPIGGQGVTMALKRALETEPDPWLRRLLTEVIGEREPSP